MIFGYVLLSLSIISLTFFYVLSRQNKDIPWLYVISGNALLFMTGLGIISLKKWGYYLLKIFLYVIVLAFPIGTFISYKVLTYIKINDVKLFLK